MYFFRLIRFQNLLIIALAQYLLKFTVIKPFFESSDISLELSEFNFFLLVLSTVLIAAGGYIINDVFDVEIDLHNKPEKVIIGKKISPAAAKKISITLSAAGVLIGIYLTYFENVRPIALMNLLTVGLLWFYSQSYKHILLVGNVVIATLSALAVFIVVFSENELVYTINHLDVPLYSTVQYNMRMVLKIALAYSAFAFVISMVREIVKDMQDMEGDQLHDSKTMPVVLGITKSKIFAILILMTALVSIVRIQIAGAQWDNRIIFWYTIACIQVPIVVAGILISVMKSKKQFGAVSLLLKLIMVSGILSMYVFHRYS